MEPTPGQESPNVPELVGADYLGAWEYRECGAGGEKGWFRNFQAGDWGAGGWSFVVLHGTHASSGVDGPWVAVSGDTDRMDSTDARLLAAALTHAADELEHFEAANQLR
jgi:hypothetical protein